MIKKRKEKEKKNLHRKETEKNFWYLNKYL